MVVFSQVNTAEIWPLESEELTTQHGIYNNAYAVCQVVHNYA